MFPFITGVSAPCHNTIMCVRLHRNGHSNGEFLTHNNWRIAGKESKESNRFEKQKVHKRRRHNTRFDRFWARIQQQSRVEYYDKSWKKNYALSTERNRREREIVLAYSKRAFVYFMCAHFCKFYLFEFFFLIFQGEKFNSARKKTEENHYLQLRRKSHT